MLHFLPPTARGVIASLLLVLNTLLWAPLLLVVSLARFPLPVAAWHRACTAVATHIAELWMWCNNGWMRLTQRLDWQVEGLAGLERRNWYLLIANHQSWADIFVLQYLFGRRIPMPKFFLKQELIWVPLIGLCWWALDFPFMKRHSKEYLARHPEKRGSDFETTRRACEKFRRAPVTIINFVEGTRFTAAKREAQQSPYRHLLRPRAGGVGYVVGAMGDRMRELLDVTIAYPGGVGPGFWDFLCGRAPRLSVITRLRDIPAVFAGRNYTSDEAFQLDFQQWLGGIWEEKDRTLAALHRRDGPQIAA